MHEFKIIHFSLEISYIKSIVSLAVETATWYSIPLNKRPSSLRNKNSPVMSFIIHVLVARDHATIIRCNFILTEINWFAKTIFCHQALFNIELSLYPNIKNLVAARIIRDYEAHLSRTQKKFIYCILSYLALEEMRKMSKHKIM